MKKPIAIILTTVAAAVSLLGVLIILAAVFIDGYGTRIKFEGGELYYTENVTLVEAEMLREQLVEMMEENDNEGTWQLDRDGSDLVVRMCTQPEAYNSDSTDVYFIAMEAVLQSVFKNQNVRVELTNDALETKKSFDKFELKLSGEDIPLAVSQLLNN